MTTTIVDGLDATKQHYARETDLDYATWAVRLISATMQIPSGSDYARGLFVDLDATKEYTIYERQGGSPAADDPPVRFLSVDLDLLIKAKTDLITSGGQLYVSSSSNGMLEATKAYVFAFDRTTGEPKTGDAANITAKWVKDYGTPGNLVGNPTEVEDGVYVFDLTESDRTFSKVAYILPESSTSNIVVRGDPPVYSMIESLVRARTDLITPSTTYVINRISGSGVNFNVVAFVGESHLISIPSSDYSAVELEVVFQNINDNRDVAVIADGSLTKTTTQVSFAMPAKVRAKEQNLRYAVRRLSNNEVLLYGTWEVRPAALKSA